LLYNHLHIIVSRTGYVIKLIGHMNSFSLMFFGFAVRFFLYSIITNPVWVLPVEILNGVTFALAYSAATSYAALIAPAGAEGTLQGLLGTAMIGLGKYNMQYSTSPTSQGQDGSNSTFIVLRKSDQKLNTEIGT